MTTLTAMTIPTRFEDEYPEEAKVLMELCKHKELRKSVQAFEDRFPNSERIYDNLNPLKAYINATVRTLWGGSKTPYKRSQPKINRNEPCPCGSGKKYKKCCNNA